MGLSGGQVLRRVEFPLALPLILAGFRTSTVNVLATVALAALFAQGGLGRYIVDGQATNDKAQMFAGAVLVALLAVVVDQVIAAVARRASPLERSRRGSSLVRAQAEAVQTETRAAAEIAS
jgi:osmoprotectant transport system permease protein